MEFGIKVSSQDKKNFSLHIWLLFAISEMLSEF